jgi:hypothetical protein
VFQPDEQRDEDQASIAELEQLLGRATRQIEILGAHLILLFFGLMSLIVGVAIKVGVEVRDQNG